MAIDQTNPADPQAQGAGSEGANKLYAGKYKTPEELEAGYKEAERMAHEAAQREAEWKRIVESSRSPEYGSQTRESYVPMGNPGGTTNPDQAAQVLTRFYSDPQGVLKEVADTAAQQAEQRMLQRQQQEASLRQRVQTWQEKNPDVVAYQELLDFHVRQTDGRLAPETRLDQAASIVRKRIVEIKGKPAGASPNPSEFVPGPSGTHDEPAGSQKPQAQEPSAGGEAALLSYVSQRSAGRIKRPGTHH